MGRTTLGRPIVLDCRNISWDQTEELRGFPPDGGEILVNL